MAEQNDTSPTSERPDSVAAIHEPRPGVVVTVGGLMIEFEAEDTGAG